MGEKRVFSINASGKTWDAHAKMKLSPYLIPYMKIHSKYIHYLNIRHKVIQTLGRKHREKHHDIELGIDFLDMTPQKQATK